MLHLSAIYRAHHIGNMALETVGIFVKGISILNIFQGTQRTLSLFARLRCKFIYQEHSFTVEKEICLFFLNVIQKHTLELGSRFVNK